LRFEFKEFSIEQSRSALKVGTDAMILGAISEHKNPQRILDIGTGTGVLSLVMAQKYPNAKIEALDIDAESLLDCAQNFKNSPWNDNLDCKKINFNRFETSNNFDLIISNPPFYENALKSENSRTNRAKHEDDQLIENIFIKSTELLHSEGLLWLILPYSSFDKWNKFAKEQELFLVKNYSIFAKPDRPKRSVLAFGLDGKIEVRNFDLILRDESGNYSEEYKLLTRDFHSKEL